MRLHRIAHFQAAGLDLAVVAKHIGLDLERVGHVELAARVVKHALVAHLTARLGVKRCGVQHHHARLTGFQFGHGVAVSVQGQHFGVGRQVFIAHKVVARAHIVEGLVHLELACRTGLGFLLFHGGGKTRLVHAQAALAAHIGRQVEREAIGVMQLEGQFAWQHLHATVEGGVQNLHAALQGFKEALFFHTQNVGNAIGLVGHVGVSRAHELHQIGHQLVEKRGLLTQQITVTNRAAHDAALHIAPAFVARYHTIAHQKRGGADVVGDHAQRLVVQVGAAGFTRRGFDQRVKNVDLVVAVNVLQDGGQTLEPHARVHARCGQRRDGTGFVHVELHEHVVPNLDEAVTVFIGAAGGTTGNVGTVVVKNLRARTARSGVGHHPEVVGLVATALVVTNADDAVFCLDALRRPARFDENALPNGMGFIVFQVHRGVKLVGGQLVDLGQQLPRPLQRLALEIVTKRPVAQHLEKGVMAGGVAHVFQVVVLATGPQAGLHGRGAHIGALVRAQKHIFELDHARVGEHQSGIVAGHQGAGRHHGMTLGLKKVQKGLADIGNGNNGGAHGFDSFQVQRAIISLRLGA